MLIPLSTRRRRPAHTRQRGITLLESLVALMVLAIAVLAMLALQLRTLVEARTGVHRAQAVRVIEDLAERIKSNPEGFALLAEYSASWDAEAPSALADCASAPCSAQQMARWDLAEWRASLARKLPRGRANTFLSPDESAGLRRQLGVMVGWHANERTDDADYLQHFAPPPETPADIACPDGLICHLVYVQP